MAEERGKKKRKRKRENVERRGGRNEGEREERGEGGRNEGEKEKNLV